LEDPNAGFLVSALVHAQHSASHQSSYAAAAFANVLLAIVAGALAATALLAEKAGRDSGIEIPYPGYTPTLIPYPAPAPLDKQAEPERIVLAIAVVVAAAKDMLGVAAIALSLLLHPDHIARKNFLSVVPAAPPVHAGGNIVDNHFPRSSLLFHRNEIGKVYYSSGILLKTYCTALPTKHTA
jgi:hypothetical protein